MRSFLVSFITSSGGVIILPFYALQSTSRDNPDYLKNAAATLKHYGFVCGTQIRQLFPIPSPETARELAIPTTGDLVPHCALLVAAHPAITPTFIGRLELYDKNGKRTGLVQTDAGYQLIGHKDRRGAKLAQQIIPLNERTTEVVQQIISLTQPLRAYLQAKKDDSWRYLLLSSGKGFAHPRKMFKVGREGSDSHRIERMAVELSHITTLSMEKRRDIARRFSLPALRASAGVLVYLKTRSVMEMAKALGHAKFNKKLLSCYLPELILAFFQERWIRIFQTAILVEALKDSEHLLRVSDFASMDELDEFLQNHALKTIPKHLEDPESVKADTKTSRQPSSEIAFGVNTGILTILISLQLAVSRADKRVNAKARYWAGITERLVNYMESELFHREDLRTHLESAKRKADPSDMESVIYA